MMDEVIEQIKCTVCFDAHSQIYQCSNGHIMCKDCISRQGSPGLIKCAVCRSVTGWSRNRAVEKMFELLKIQVACGIAECCTCTKLQDISEHRKTCAFRTYECPIHDSCPEMCLSDLIEHVQKYKDHVKEVESTCEWLNMRFFSNSKAMRQVILYKTIILILDFVFHESCSPWYDIYAQTIGAPLRIKIRNINPTNYMYEECVTLAFEDNKPIFRPKSYESCIVSDSHSGISSCLNEQIVCDASELGFFRNDLSGFHLFTRDNFANFISLQIQE